MFEYKIKICKFCLLKLWIS